MKKLLYIVELLRCGIISEKTNKYRLETKTIDSDHDCFVELKLYYKNKVVLRIKEGNLKGRTYKCSNKEHKLLEKLGITTIFYV